MIYYFVKNNESSTLLKNIDLYTSNKYEIIIDKYFIFRNNIKYKYDK